MAPREFGNAMIVGEAPTIDHYRLAFDTHLDVVAAQRQYYDRLTVVSYAGSTNPQWATEAEAFIAWRDAALSHMFQQLAAVEASEIAPPSIEEFIGGITPIVWPNP
jgi:chitinase